MHGVVYPPLWGDTEQFLCFKYPLISTHYLSLLPYCPLPPTLATADLFPVSIVSPFPEHHVVGVIQ